MLLVFSGMGMAIICAYQGVATAEIDDKITCFGLSVCLAMLASLKLSDECNKP